MLTAPALAFIVCLLAVALAFIVEGLSLRWRSRARVGAACLSLLAVALLLGGCAALGLTGPAGDPMPRLVGASRQTHDVIAPRFIAYVRADATLDPLVRDQLEKLVGDWRLSIEQAEAYLSPLPAPAPAPAR